MGWEGTTYADQQQVFDELGQGAPHPPLSTRDGRLTI